ncbi:MAG TPA: hypothetical protein VHX14_14025, partial [Thermoanaerobaculia bacterium]|nr:hypothetical protein [Thermoanaerobaculia bacterium]
MSRPFRFFASCLILLGCGVLRAATYVVPPDEVMIGRADVIVIARALHAHVESTPERGIETITVFAIEEVLKGDVADGFRVHSPGGVIEREDHRIESEIVPGAPAFLDGERFLLFLKKTPDGDYATADLGLGLFSFATDNLGTPLIPAYAGLVLIGLGFLARKSPAARKHAMHTAAL